MLGADPYLCPSSRLFVHWRLDSGGIPEVLQ